MHIHVLGICGKFMSGLAVIASQMGHRVTGSDENLIPLVIDRLTAHGIKVTQGYQIDTLPQGVDCVVIGNALSRGKPVIEHILNTGIVYASGPEWLSRHVLAHRWVLAVSGTHGKTTTTSMLAWVLESAGLNPGFLIGGDPLNFDVFARYTDSNFFVIEADEYDTAFFDKRSKFLHYHPKTLIINNLEFDHADIFDSLEDIKKQFCHLVRIVPQQGLIITPYEDPHIDNILLKGCWTPIQTVGAGKADWKSKKINPEGATFEVTLQDKTEGTVNWSLVGEHNIHNALAALAAARHVGILPAIGIKALNQFKGVKRRLELKGVVNHVYVYEDFAHHPTAIAMTLQALRGRVNQQPIFAILELGSNTLKAGHYKDTLAQAFKQADHVILLNPAKALWELDSIIPQFSQPVNIFDSVSDIVTYMANQCQGGEHILCMSNLLFDGIHQKLLSALSLRFNLDELTSN